MSARIPSRRLGHTALAAFRPPPTYWTTTPRSSVRTLRTNTRLRNATPQKPSKITDPNDPRYNPVIEEYLAKHDPTEKPNRPTAQTGKVSQAETSLFKPEYELPGYSESMTEAEIAKLRKREEARLAEEERIREQELHALKLDPAPGARRRMERELIIENLKKRGRVTKDIKLARTERQSIYKSPHLPTSVKKLTKLMNQIQGKTVEEALVQLRFSKKRVARDVWKGLQIARDEAIAARGMGLGSLPAPSTETTEEGEQPEQSVENEAESETYLADGTRLRPKKNEPKLIELKDGSKKIVHDPTEMYIDQAWVGKGEMWKSLEFRARGRTNQLRHRTTSFSVLLKEEKTRMRLSEEIQKKRENRKLWLPLPDRPVTSQRQYCLW